MSWLSSKLVTVDKGSEKSVWHYSLWWVDLMVDLVDPVVDQCRVHLVMLWWVMPGEAAGGFLSSRAEGAVVQGEFRCDFLVPWFLGGKALLPKRSMSSSQNSCLPFAISYLVILSSCQPLILSSFYFFFYFFRLSSCHLVKFIQLNQLLIWLTNLSSCQ